LGYHVFSSLSCYQINTQIISYHSKAFHGLWSKTDRLYLDSLIGR
jgi:hypothetical protein